VIKQPELEIKLRQADTNTHSARASLEELQRNQTNEEELEKRDLSAQRSMLSRIITNYTALVANLTARSNEVSELFKKGLVPRPTALDAQNALYTAQYDLYRSQLQLEQLQTAQFQAGVRRRQELAERAEQHRQALHQLEYSSNLYVLNTEVRSPYPGQILEALVKPGDLITASTPIVSLQGATNDLEARIFLNSSDGKRLAARFHPARANSASPARSGAAAAESMEVLLAPVSVRKEEFGLMRGEVDEVSAYPVTPQGMLRALENPTLVAEFSQGGAPMEVTVRLLKSTNTESGFVWTSANGPPVPITSGTLCEGTITIDRRPPISLVLPFLSKSFRH
jgi:HlyD family secretion protein